MKISYVIVINTFKRPMFLVERTLRSILRQDILPEKVILIDQNHDELSELADDLKNNLIFERITCNKMSVSKARNMILKRNIPQDWVVFCDDDGYFADNYSLIFAAILKKEPQIEVISGSIIRDDNLEFYSKRHQIGGSLKKFANQKLLMGSNFAVKTEIFKKLNGFDENFGAGAFYGSSEETDFAWKVYYGGHKSEYFKELQVLHVRPYNSDLKQSLLKAWRYGFGKGGLVSKWILKGKYQVLFEAMEMTIVPILKILFSLVTFNMKNLLINFVVLFSRYVGLLAFPAFYAFERLQRRRELEIST